MLDSPSAEVFMEEYEMESWLHYGMELERGIMNGILEMDLLDPMMEFSAPSPPIEMPSMVAELMVDELQKIVDSGMEVVGESRESAVVEDPRDNVAPLAVEVAASDHAGSSTIGGMKRKALSESDVSTDLGPKRERRRDRINENMKILQKLIPRCNKTDKASMLDEAIDYMKSLQLQVQIMTMACDNMRAIMCPGASRASGVQGFYPITTGVQPIASMNGGLLLGTEVVASTGGTAQPLISFGQVFTTAPLSGSPQVVLAPRAVSSPNMANPDQVSERAADPPVPALVSTNTNEPSLVETPTTADPNADSQVCSLVLLAN
ncbi:hypothetical protein J5N97_023483 [Dioscorea zingiberensis]|uniref:BHLH domain-containing protein n=1 Tax=Dioscorea zingiberensis TaxID=325984 RepID=A0A9D5C4I6_9LILI|nr:hypothetical protein J5N97_023483 [Dioscorea zingiberensis]